MRFVASYGHSGTKDILNSIFYDFVMCTGNLELLSLDEIFARSVDLKIQIYIIQGIYIIYTLYTYNVILFRHYIIVLWDIIITLSGHCMHT